MKSTRFAILCVALGLSSFFNHQSHAQITVDGTRDSGYGSALAVQTCGTGFGAGAGGSSLANAYAINDGTHLYLFIGGNLETNWNKLAIFLDTKTGGQNKLSNTGGADFGFLAKLNDLEFDTGFDADALINVRWGGTELYADIDTFGSGSSAPTPTTTAIAGGAVTGAGSAKTATVSLAGALLVIDNSATGGPTASDAGSSSSVTTGLEIKIPLTALGSPAGDIKICALISNGGGDYLSNQTLAGLPLGTANLANTKNLWNLKNYSGNQLFTVSAPAVVDTDGDTIPDSTDPDDDNDGLTDVVETNTGIFVDATNTGSNPLNADTDSDGINDGPEVTAGTNPNKANFTSMAAPGSYAFSGPWSPDGSSGTAMTKVGEFGWSLQRYFGTLGNFVSKFAANGTWDKQWGYSGTPGKALAGGGDITNSVTQTGIHLYTFNNDTLDFTFARVTFSDYASYATAYGLTGTQTDDFDSDGINNGDEFTANTDPTRANDAQAPTVALAEGVAKMVWVELNGTAPTPSSSDVTASDNVTLAASLQYDIQPATVDTTTAGFKTVTYTVQDEAGNFSSLQRVFAVGDVKADYFNLQYPAAMTINTSSSGDVYAQIFIPNVTQGAGAAPAIQAWVGVNTADTDPSTWASSAWSPATYLGEVGNNDEYKATITGSGLAVGTHYYAVRWQIGSGAFAYSGITAGGNGGEWGTTYTDNATPPVSSTRGNGVLTVEGTRQVTFAVDMGVQIFKGAFDPSTNGVEIRGDLNGFTGGVSTLAREGTSSIYSGTFTVGGNEGASQGYKFFGTGTNALSWETMANNRSMILGAVGSSTNLPTAYFNDLSESRKITFRVDMSVQAAKGAFNTNSGVVQLAGSFNGWSTTATPLSAQGNGVYAAEVTVDGPVSGISYKFLKGTTEADYEVVSDRTISAVLPNLAASTLDVVLFGNDDGVAPTDISLSASSIAENNAVNAVVGTLSSADASAGDTHTYSLVTGTGDTDNASFNISGSDLRAGVAFDFETKASYSIRVRSTDSKGNSFEETFTVTVTDVNETPAGSTYAGWSGGEPLTSATLGKYAIGGASSPTATDGVKPTSTVSGGNLVLTAIVRTDDPKLAVVGEVVTSLANYASGTSVTEVTGSASGIDQTGVPAGFEKRAFTVPQGADTRKFLRLKATLQP
jgi:hypothetical protein